MCAYQLWSKTSVFQSAVVVSCKLPATGFKTIEDYRFSLVEGMFHNALNQRFFKISRQKDPPFFSCSSTGDNLVHPVKAYLLSASCKEKGTLQALESVLTEVDRLGSSQMLYHLHLEMIS